MNILRIKITKELKVSKSLKLIVNSSGENTSTSPNSITVTGISHLLHCKCWFTNAARKIGYLKRRCMLSCFRCAGLRKKRCVSVLIYVILCQVKNISLDSLKNPFHYFWKSIFLRLFFISDKIIHHHSSPNFPIFVISDLTPCLENIYFVFRFWSFTQAL